MLEKTNCWCGIGRESSEESFEDLGEAFSYPEPEWINTAPGTSPQRTSSTSFEARFQGWNKLTHYHRYGESTKPSEVKSTAGAGYCIFGSCWNNTVTFTYVGHTPGKHGLQSSGSKAIVGLRRLGNRPSSPLSKDISILDNALDALILLGQNMGIPSFRDQTLGYIKNNWEACIGPWVEFFFDHYALPDTEGANIGFIDKVYFAIGLIICYPKAYSATSDAGRDQLLRMAPYLPTYSSRVWLKLMHLDPVHWTLQYWCSILNYIIHIPGSSLPFVETLTNASPGYDLVHICVRYLNRVTRSIDVMDDLELIVFRETLSIFAFSLGFDTPYAAPLNIIFLQYGGAPVPFTVWIVILGATLRFRVLASGRRTWTQAT
ncbi:hypothetical protein WG66_012072 [Moniliophthora roreri]|uniref:Uncharacterized protein n=1 Tax=Moniliophthora roreri TaxID=221103 RepID=A0A0W0G9E6_MONRR|nr:hypothetical protein WG66_012072 [Moniliophthora roreri]